MLLLSYSVNMLAYFMAAYLFTRETDLIYLAFADFVGVNNICSRVLV